jgi:hypothetical protein
LYEQLLIVKRSTPYRNLYNLFAGAKPFMPNENWTENGHTYFQFDLKSSKIELVIPPMVLFVLNEDNELVLVRSVETDVKAGDMMVQDLFRKGVEVG